MIPKYRLIVLIAGALFSIAATAEASVIYRFEGDTVTPRGAFTFVGQLAVEQATAAAGFAVDYVNQGYTTDEPPTQPPYKPILLEGLLGFRADILDGRTGLSRFSLSQDDIENLFGGPNSGMIARVQLAADPGGPLQGSIFFNNQEQDLTLAFGGGFFSGAFNTDFVGPAPCRFSGVCTFAGPVTVSVPEPSTLSLLAVGAVAFFAARRRVARRA